MSNGLGEFLTRWSVRAAVACYVAWFATDRRVAVLSPVQARTSRWLWTAGLLCLWLHVVSAFQFYHHWSHSAAYAETARQTAAVTGFSWGGGLYFNYLFTAWWTLDVAAGWYRPALRCRRNRAYRRGLNAYFAFMFVNATIVFGPPVWRWVGIPALIGLLAWWLKSPARARHVIRNCDSRGP